MLQGGAPCVVEAHLSYLQRFIKEQRLLDVFLFNSQETNVKCSIGKACNFSKLHFDEMKRLNLERTCFGATYLSEMQT